MQQNLRASILPLALLLLLLGPGMDGAARAQATAAWSLSGFGMQ